MEEKSLEWRLTMEKWNKMESEIHDLKAENERLRNELYGVEDAKLYLQGWVCPLCGCVYSPWTTACPNHVAKVITETDGTTHGNKG